MLEGRSYLISRALPSSCEQESNWVYMTCCLMEVSNGKRRLDDEGEEELMGERKLSKRLENTFEGEGMSFISQDLSLSMADQSDQLGHYRDDQEDTDVKLRLQIVDEEELIGERKSSTPLEMHESEEMTPALYDLNLTPADDKWEEEQLGEITSANSVDMNVGEETIHTFHDISMSPSDESVHQNHDEDGADTSSLIQPLGRDITINCLLRCSRSDYNSIASLNQSFRNLIRQGELYRLRRQIGVIEHWVYFSCHVLEWEAFDPIRRRWMHLPRMLSNECFMCSDKESLAVGTELLVFGKEITSHVIWKYSILTNSWSSGMKMNTPRCLFGSASLGKIAILAGGCDSQGRVFNTAELYNSETGTWEILPSMNKARKMCSAVFMDGKFYVIGGSNSELLSCGEEFDLETRTWREIPNMFPRLNGPTEAPPLVAVVNNELYAADYAEKEVRKYDKEMVSWVTVGRLPEQAVSMNGWGLAFRACGEHLIVIGGPRTLGGGMIELNSWIPREGPPQWNLLARKHSASFVYNCAVMGC